MGRESCREAKGGIEWRDREKSPLGFHCRIFISKDSYTRLVTKNAGLFLNALIYQEMEPIPLKYKVFFLMPDDKSSQFTFFFHLGTETFTSTEFFPWIQKVLIIIGMQH